MVAVLHIVDNDGIKYSNNTVNYADHMNYDNVLFTFNNTIADKSETWETTHI